MDTRTTRRLALLGAAGLGALGAWGGGGDPKSIVIATAPDTVNADLYREADHCQALRDRVNVPGHTEKQETEWETAEDAFLRKVEALPPTAANAPIKARALTLLYEGDVTNILDHYAVATTDIRLMVQVVQAMTGVA